MGISGHPYPVLRLVEAARAENSQTPFRNLRWCTPYSSIPGATMQFRSTSALWACAPHRLCASPAIRQELTKPPAYNPEFNSRPRVARVRAGNGASGRGPMMQVRLHSPALRFSADGRATAAQRGLEDDDHEGNAVVECRPRDEVLVRPHLIVPDEAAVSRYILVPEREQVKAG